MSRITPPKVALITPIAIAMNALAPAVSARSAPTTQNSASPAASSQSNTRQRDSGMRARMPAAAARTSPQSDHDILTSLNTDYINSVQHSDAKRFDEILAPEFYCSNPDGSLLGRAAFLTQTAKPVAIRNLRAEDVLIRIMG